MSRHHTGEDTVAFPALAESFPELRPVLAELSRDHAMVTDILRRLETLLASSASVRDLRAEVDGLSALLESHFVYEEKRIVSALNSLNVPEWDEAKPDFLLG